MDFQYVINLAAGLMFGVVGWFGREMLELFVVVVLCCQCFSFGVCRGVGISIR